MKTRVYLKYPVNGCIAIIANNDTGIPPPESYARGYHAHTNIWNATTNDYLQCNIEENNELDPSAVAPLDDDCLEEKVVGQVPIHLSKIFHRFLKLHFAVYRQLLLAKG